MAPLLFAWSTLSLLAVCVQGHGYLTVPAARNGNENGLVAGGPATVHGGKGYIHGLCGNKPKEPQNWNEVGDVQAKWVSGSVVDISVLITAHHVGYFEFELCDNAADLSEECFAKHRLLRVGCSCTCPDAEPEDDSHSCQECETCRRWWKPVLRGEMGQSVIGDDYAGVVLPADGNLVPVNYTMQYVIPEQLKSSRAVVRWHYMTTNSCTSDSSDPEEFWNCADVAISDASGDFGPPIDYDNGALSERKPVDLRPYMNDGRLPGVQADCPRYPDGDLMGTGNPEEYWKGQCGAYDINNDTWSWCFIQGGGAGGFNCTDKPDNFYKCIKECGDWYWSCAHGIAYMRPVPGGSVCQGDSWTSPELCEVNKPIPGPDDPEGPCDKVPGNNQGCTDALCAPCATGQTWWPCNVEPACCKCMVD